MTDGDHIIKHINVASLCSIPETTTILYANYTLIIFKVCVLNNLIIFHGISPQNVQTFYLMFDVIKHLNPAVNFLLF